MNCIMYCKFYISFKIGNLNTILSWIFSSSSSYSTPPIPLAWCNWFWLITLCYYDDVGECLILHQKIWQQSWDCVIISPLKQYPFFGNWHGGVCLAVGFAWIQICCIVLTDECVWFAVNVLIYPLWSYAWHFHLHLCTLYPTWRMGVMSEIIKYNFHFQHANLNCMNFNHVWSCKAPMCLTNADTRGTLNPSLKFDLEYNIFTFCTMYMALGCIWLMFRICCESKKSTIKLSESILLTNSMEEYIMSIGLAMHHKC